jgi:hypothetical protein
LWNVYSSAAFVAIKAVCLKLTATPLKEVWQSAKHAVLGTANLLRPETTEQQHHVDLMQLQICNGVSWLLAQ